MVRPGKLRKTLTIKTATLTRGANGFEIETPSTFAARKCEPMPISSSDKLANDALISENIIKWRLRYLSGVTSKMFCEYGGRHFEIIGIENEREENRVLYITGKEVK